jgi:predicted hotdog family 3-hydroxylacyl-ACP dehydratase
MLLIDSLQEWDDEQAVARAVIKTQNVFCENGSVPAVVALELMAQCIAAHMGRQQKPERAPSRPGFLISCRELLLQVDELRVGDALKIETRAVWADDTTGRFDCRVTRGADDIATGTLTVYRAPAALTEAP